MWWRLIILTGLFVVAVRMIPREAERRHHGACLVVHNPENGHYYQWIQSPNTHFNNALIWSPECRFAGTPGHLATITTQAEQDFLAEHRATIGSSWIAASDRDQEGTWKWMAGPEKGEVFFIEGDEGHEHGFHAWSENEPNDHDGDEDYGMFGWLGDSWNDLSDMNYRVDGFLVEYEGLPEPEKVVATAGNTFSPFYGSERPTILGTKHGQSWSF
jgi:hypothetical protein